MRIRDVFKRHRRTLLEAAVIFVIALLPRLIGSDVFLTADEKNWLVRSYEFLKAMREFRINDTFLTTHPGIPTLWVTGVTLFLASRAIHVPFNLGDLHRFATLAHIPMAGINAGLVVAVFLAARLLLPRNVAFLGAVFIALNPYLIGHSKIVHVDAFLAGFLLLAVLLILTAVTRRSDGAFVLSAFAGALALLAKMPGVFIVPFAGLLFATAPAAARLALDGRAVASQPRWRGVVRAYGQWLFLFGLTVLLLWPALLWVPDPLGNANIIRRDMTTAIGTPHNMEESYSLSPWHYPAALLSRTSLVSLVGLCILAAGLLSSRVRRVLTGAVAPRTLTFLVVFIVGFMAMMTLGAKKGDRYILPVFPALDLLAAIGFLIALPAFVKRRSLVRGVVGSAVAGCLALLAWLGPYAIAYTNPLVPPNFSEELGWGEGLDQVARYLDAQQDTAMVASWYPEELRALTRHPVLHINAHEQPRIGYIVLYRNMFGRPPDHWANDFIDEYYRKRDPVFVATVRGLPYAWVYKRPLFTGIVGRLTPRQKVTARITARADGLARVESLVATYSGTARVGTLLFRLRDNEGLAVREGRVSLQGLEDNTYAVFSFDPILGSAGKSYAAEFTTEGTDGTNAPTLRYAPAEDATFIFSQSGASGVTEKPRQGLLAVRTAYRVGAADVTDEELKRQ